MDRWRFKGGVFHKLRQPVSGRGRRRMRAITCEGNTCETRGENNRAMMSWGKVLTRKRDGQTETVYSHRSGLITFYCLAHKSVTSHIRHDGHCNITCWGNTPPTEQDPTTFLSPPIPASSLSPQRPLCSLAPSTFPSWVWARTMYPFIPLLLKSTAPKSGY